MKKLKYINEFENKQLIKFTLNDSSSGNYVYPPAELFYNNSAYALYIDRTIYNNHYYLIIVDMTNEILDIESVLGKYNNLYIKDKINKKDLDNYIQDGLEIIELVKKFINNDESTIKQYFAKIKSKNFNL